MRDTEREREAETQAEGEAGSMEGAPCGTPGSPGSCPGLKVALNHWATRAILQITLNEAIIQRLTITIVLLASWEIRVYASSVPVHSLLGHWMCCFVTLWTTICPHASTQNHQLHQYQNYPWSSTESVDFNWIRVCFSHSAAFLVFVDA